ncbi:MAG: hypothetical protein AB1511_00385 [Deinococcota bacterium]
MTALSEPCSRLVLMGTGPVGENLLRVGFPRAVYKRSFQSSAALRARVAESAAEALAEELILARAGRPGPTRVRVILSLPEEAET